MVAVSVETPLVVLTVSVTGSVLRLAILALDQTGSEADFLYWTVEKPEPKLVASILIVRSLVVDT